MFSLLNIYAPSNRASKPRLIELQGKIEKSTIVFNTLFSVTGKRSDNVK